jgi:hypothetical protein
VETTLLPPRRTCCAANADAAHRNVENFGQRLVRIFRRVYPCEERRPPYAVLVCAGTDAPENVTSIASPGLRSQSAPGIIQAG